MNRPHGSSPSRLTALLLVVLAFVLAACGGSPPAAPAADNATDASAATTAPATQAATAPENPAPTEAAAVTAGDTAAQGAATGTPEGTLTVVQALLPLAADPHVEYLNSSWHINYSIYDPLARVNEQGELQPYLATSWEMESPTSWIFNLRENVQWHDGAPFTADDVVWSIERLLDPETKSIWTGIYSYVSGAETVDDLTVRVTTNRPVVALPQDFGRMAMLPQAQFEAAGKDAFLQNPIGTGPFRFSSQVAGEEITLEANETYWGGAPNVQTLVFKQVPDAATRVAELLAGTADIVDAIPPNELERINSSSTASVIAAPTVRRILIEFAMSTTPELNDLRVRQAVAHAIDTETINQSLYGGQAGAQPGWLDRYSWGHNENLEPHAYDPERSKQLLAEAGYPEGLPVTFTIGTGRFSLDQEVGLAVADYLGKAGFNVDFQAMEWGAFSQARAAGELEGLYMLSSGNSTGEPDQVFRSFDTAREAVYLSDPRLDELIHAQAGETDRDLRAEMVAAVDEYIHNNVMSVNLMTVPGFYGLNNRVEGFVPSPFEIFSFTTVSVE